MKGVFMNLANRIGKNSRLEKIKAFLGLYLTPLTNPFENYRILRGFLQNISITFVKGNNQIDHSQPVNSKSKAEQADNRCPINCFKVSHRFYGIDNA